MKKLLVGIAALPFLASAASAQPISLSDGQMDKVTAGFVYYVGGAGEFVKVGVNPHSPDATAFCGKVVEIMV